MKLLIIYLHFLPLSLYCQAKTYYVSTTGNDQNNGLSLSGAWQTLGKVSAADLEPGDKVLFKRGDVFTGSLTLSRSGLPGNPIVIGAYGSGEKPVISGLTGIRGWVSLGGNIWEAPLAGGAYVNTVVVSNRLQGMGRYPNIDAANRGYLTYNSPVGSSGITGSTDAGTTNWTGAELVIRKQHWVIDRGKILKHSGQQISYSGTPPNNGGTAGFGYFIQNDPKTLDRQHEWYYNPQAQTLRMYSSVNPATLNVRASTTDVLVAVSGQSYITFDNIAFSGGDASNLYLFNTRFNVIRYCDFDFMGQDGITGDGSSYTNIQYCTFTNSNSNACYFKSVTSGLETNYTTISHCAIKNMGLLPGMGGQNDDQHVGIHCHNTSLVEYCTLDSIGGNAIIFRGDSSVVRYNYITNFNLTVDDAAGIYSHGGFDKKGREVYGNVIINGRGAPEGTADGYSGSSGIYIDDLSANVNIHDNTVADCARAGIHLHNSHEITIRRNTVYNCTIQVLFDHTGFPDHPFRNMNVKSNILFSAQPSQMLVYHQTLADDIRRFGAFDSNYYARPIDPSGVIYTQYDDGTGALGAYYDLPSWKKVYGWDLHSSTPQPFEPYKVTNATGPNLVTNGSFNSDNNGVSVLNNAGEISARPDTKLDGSALKVTASSGLAQVMIHMGPAAANQTYRIRFSLLGSSHKANLAASLVNADFSSGYGTRIYVPLTDKRTENEFLYKTTHGYSDLTLFLSCRAEMAGMPFWIDNVDVRNVTATFTNPFSLLKFVHNGSNAPVSYSLNGTYKDVRNVTYENKIILKAFSSAILIKVSPAAGFRTSG